MKPLIKKINNLKKLNYYSILKHLTLGVDVLFAFLLLFDYLSYLPEFWSINITYIFYFVVAVNTCFLAFKINKIPEAERKDSKMIYYFSHFFLLSLVVIALNQFLKRAWIIEHLSEISALAIGLGFLTFYAYRSKVEKEIEEEKVSEEKAEKERFKEFGNKFPFWNRILVLRRFVRWMYKEGWWYAVGLILIVVLGFVLRVWNVENITPGRDEFHQIIAGKNFYENGIFYCTRSTYITYITAFLFKIFGTDLLFARSPAIVFGSLISILIYFLAKKINKKIGMISAFLWATLPWAIAMSQFLREYIFVIFITLLFFLIIFNHFKKYSEKIFSKKSIIKILVYYILFYSFVKFNGGSVGIGFLLSFIPLIILGFNYTMKNRKYKKFFYMLMIITFLIGGFFLKFVLNLFGKIGPISASNISSFGINIEWFNVFFNPFIKFPMMWYSFLNINSLLLLFFTFIGIIFLYKNKEYIIYFITFIFTLLFFVFFIPIKEYFVARYIFYIVPFYIILLSCSFFILCLFLKNIKINKIFSFLIIVLFLVTIINPVNIYHGALNDLRIKSGDQRQVFSIENRDLNELFTFLDSQNFSNENIVITTIPDVFTWYYNFDLSNGRKRCRADMVNTCYSQANNIYELKEMEKVVKLNPSGFIITEVWRKEIKKEDFILSDKKIIYLGKFSFRYGVWKWD